MGFNWDTFNKLKTASSESALRNIKSSVNRLSRKSSPLRGWVMKWSDSPDKVQQWYWDIIADLKRYILDSNLSPDQKKSLLIWEIDFQSHQKGPVGPLSGEQLYTQVINPLRHKQLFEITSESKSILQGINADLTKYYGQFINIDPLSIDYQATWSLLPNQTIRGFPFNCKGLLADPQIIKLGGKTFYSAFKYFKSMDFIPCFPGYRYQGKPVEKGAKIRLIFIPTPASQYLDVGLITQSMNQLKAAPTFAAWTPPEQRYHTIYDLLRRADNDGYVILALDFSGFDTNVSHFMQTLPNRILVENSQHKELMEQFDEQYNKLLNNQYIFLPIDGHVKPIWIPMQWISGKKRTNHDGSFINLHIQAYIAKKLGFEFRPDLALAQGDDVGIPIPKTVLAEYGYNNLLKEMNKIANELGFTIHTTKAYPTTQLTYLQKLWDLSQGLLHVGSWARSISSFLYREKFPKKIPGIKSLPALELISQISILQESFTYGNANINSFGTIFASRWLDEDDGLYMIVKYIQESSFSNKADALFRLLIKISGLGIDQIKDFMNISSFDHNFVSLSIESADYSKVFFILDYLVSSKLPQRVITHSLKDLFNVDNFHTESDPVEIMDEGFE